MSAMYAQAGAIDQPQHQALRALDQRQNAPHLGFVQHCGQTNRLLRADKISQPRQIDLKHHLVKEEQRRQRLLLGRCRHIPLCRQMGKKRRHLSRPHLTRVAHPVEPDEAADPMDIGALCPYAVVP